MPHRRSSQNVIARLNDFQPFSSIEEIDRYLNNEKLECFLCGRHFGNLSNHLVQGHGVSARSYREKLGLPFRRGLVGTSTHEKMRPNGYSQREMAKIVVRGAWRKEGVSRWMVNCAKQKLNIAVEGSKKKGKKRLVVAISACEKGDTIASVARRLGMRPQTLWSGFDNNRKLLAAFKELTMPCQTQST